MYCSDQDFAEWAFGAKTWSSFMVFDLDCLDLMEAWNALHGDEFKLDGDDSIMESMAKMKTIWENRDEVL